MNLNEETTKLAPEVLSRNDVEYWKTINDCFAASSTPTSRSDCVERNVISLKIEI
jgi:hypothetical protein